MGFTFKQLAVEIAGHSFTIDTGSEKVADAIVGLIKKLQDLGVQPQGEKPKIQEMADAQALFLDDVLGDGAFEKIFKNRLISYDDLEECVLYVLNQITDFKTQRLSQYK